MINVSILNLTHHTALMKFTIQQFHQLGIYRQLSIMGIVNLMICNRVMTLKPLVSHAPLLYQYSRKIFSPFLTDFLIKQTFCKALTAGNTLYQANQISQHYRNDNISIILDFCAEGDKDSGENQVLNDENAKMFAQSAATLASNPNEMSSIKVTGIIKVLLLMKINKVVEARDQLWAQNNQEGFLKGQQAFNAFKKMCPSITQEIFKKYLREIHGFEGSIDQFQIDEVDFKMNHYPFYLEENEKNKNQLINLLFPKTPAEQNFLNNFKKRLHQIIDPQANNTTGFKILVDAEQSYVQKAIEVISEQLQHKYNKDKLYVVPTIQNYLKSSPARSKYEVQIAKRRNLKFGAKLVRGAYLVEESKLANENGTQNPIVGCFEETTSNFISNFKLMASSFSEGEIIVATHNINTVQDTASIVKEINSPMRISYAQLLGLADHLTYKAKSQGYRVYKYLPWASTSTMIPYMIRRAQELSQMKYPLSDQYALLKLELKNRLF